MIVLLINQVGDAMKCRALLPILLVSCLAPGTWMSMFFPDPCAPPKAAGLNPRRDVVLCAADECEGEKDRIAQICADNHYEAGLHVPIMPVAGVSCLCPCLE